MIILLTQITGTPREVDFREWFDGPDIEGVRFVSPIHVNVAYHRSGNDLFFDGRLRLALEGICSRCLEAYRFGIEKKFDLVLIPDTPPSNKNRGLSREEMDLSVYRGEEIDLRPFVYEQAMLGIPLRPLCNEACRGLCPHCGADRNEVRCDCDTSTGDSRMSFFRSLRVDR